MPQILSRAVAALEWLGRQGTRAIAASIFGGLALPQLAAILKPCLPWAIFLLLVLSFLRVDPKALRGYASRPFKIVLAAAWLMLALPALLMIALKELGVSAAMPDLAVALVLQAASAPIMSVAAIAALMGLDAALALVLLMLCMAVNPITLPLFARLCAGEALAISPLALGIRVALLLAGSSLCALILRRLLGPARIARHHMRIDGLNVIVLFVFAVAVMDGVGAHFLSSPLPVLGLTALAFAVALASLGLTLLLFRRFGAEQTMTVGVSAACRNLGVIMAAAGAALPDQAWLYFGLAQFPLYLLPQMLMPLARRTVRKI